MANAFKNAGAALPNTNRTTIYTAPGSTASILHAIYLSNVDGSNSVNATVEATIDGGADIAYALTGSGVQKSMNADNAAIADYTQMGDLVNITAFASASEAAIVSGSAGSGSGVVQCNVELFVASI